MSSLPEILIKSKSDQIRGPKIGGVYSINLRSVSFSLPDSKSSRYARSVSSNQATKYQSPSKIQSVSFSNANANQVSNFQCIHKNAIQTVILAQTLLSSLDQDIKSIKSHLKSINSSNSEQLYQIERYIQQKSTKLLKQFKTDKKHSIHQGKAISAQVDYLAHETTSMTSLMKDLEDRSTKIQSQIL